MLRWALAKILQTAAVLLIVSAVSFSVLKLAPGDPVERILGPEASEQEVQVYRAKLGLDLPLVPQYARFLKGAIRGDFGESLFGKRPVIDLSREQRPVCMLTMAVQIDLPRALPDPGVGQEAIAIAGQSAKAAAFRRVLGV